MPYIDETYKEMHEKKERLKEEREALREDEALNLNKIDKELEELSEEIKLFKKPIYLVNKFTKQLLDLLTITEDNLSTETTRLDNAMKYLEWVRLREDEINLKNSFINEYEKEFGEVPVDTSVKIDSFFNLKTIKQAEKRDVEASVKKVRFAISLMESTFARIFEKSLLQQKTDVQTKIESFKTKSIYTDDTLASKNDISKEQFKLGFINDNLYGFVYSIQRGVIITEKIDSIKNTILMKEREEYATINRRVDIEVEAFELVSEIKPLETLIEQKTVSSEKLTDYVIDKLLEHDAKIKNIEDLVIDDLEM